MDERCFRPLLCTVKAELGWGQPGLMRWIWDETLPQSSIDRLTFYSAAHRATEWASGRPHNFNGTHDTNESIITPGQQYLLVGSLTYCSLKPLWSSIGKVLANPTSLIPSHCAVIILFKSVPVHARPKAFFYEAEQKTKSFGVFPNTGKSPIECDLCVHCILCYT